MSAEFDQPHFGRAQILFVFVTGERERNCYLKMKHNNVILIFGKSLDVNYACKDATNFHLWNGNKNCFE